MTTPDAPTRSVIVEKEFPHPPEKVWRALTDSSLMEQWLLKNDFQPVAGRAFQLHVESPQWNGIIDCKVLTIEPFSNITYTWTAMGLETVVAFTLTPTTAGTHLRMEQSGFSMDHEASYKGAKYGWQNFLGKLEHLVAELQ